MNKPHIWMLPTTGDYTRFQISPNRFRKHSLDDRVYIVSGYNVAISGSPVRGLITVLRQLKLVPV